ARTDTGAAAAGSAATPKVDKAAEEQAVRAASKHTNELLMAHDSAGLGAQFADDGSEMQPNTKLMTGPAAVTKGFGEAIRAMKDFNLSWTPSAVTIADAGDIAVERGTYQFSFTDPKGKKMTDHGNYV